MTRAILAAVILAAGTPVLIDAVRRVVEKASGSGLHPLGLHD